MYNSDQKLRFIHDITTSATVALGYERIFNRSEKIELLYSRDMCLMTREQIADVISEFTASKSSTTKGYIRQIRTYIRWCYDNGLSESYVEIDETNVDRDTQIINAMVKDPTDLQERLNILFDKESELTKDLRYRCYFWLAFMGITKDDMPKITTDDVDVALRIVELNNTVYQIPECAVDAFKACASQTFFYVSAFNMQYKSERADTNVLLRASKDVILSKSLSLSSTIDRRRKERHAIFTLRYSDILLSGMFYRMYLSEQDGVPVDFKGAIAENTHKQSTVSRKNKRYKAEYYAWKKAFNL